MSGTKVAACFFMAAIVILIADWEDMLSFVSVIGDPDDQQSIVPVSLDQFNDGFIRSKFD